MFCVLALKTYENKIIIKYANISKIILWLMDISYLINSRMPLFIKGRILFYKLAIETASFGYHWLPFLCYQNTVLDIFKVKIQLIIKCDI